MLAMREMEGVVRGAAESVAGESGAAESVAGDPMGADLAASDSAARLIFLGDPDVLAERVRDLDLPVAVETLDDRPPPFPFGRE